MKRSNLEGIGKEQWQERADERRKGERKREKEEEEEEEQENKNKNNKKTKNPQQSKEEGIKEGQGERKRILKTRLLAERKAHPTSSDTPYLVNFQLKEQPHPLPS